MCHEKTTLTHLFNLFGFPAIIPINRLNLSRYHDYRNACIENKIV